MKLSIIIPCFNERRFLPELVSQVKESPVKDNDIILVDDGSNDGTKELIKTELEKEVDKVIYHPENLGKGWVVLIEQQLFSQGVNLGHS